LNARAQKREIDLGKLDTKNAIQFHKDSIHRIISHPDVVFERACVFKHCVFLDTANFSKLVFSNEVNFDSSTFLSNASFEESDFSYASFKRCTFKKLNFEAEFHGRFELDNTTCNEMTSFSSAIFFNDAIIRNVKFNKSVDFSESEFHKMVLFSGTRFFGKADFSEMVLGDTTQFYFVQALFPDTLDFSGVQEISNEIDLTKANFTDSSRYKSSTGYYRPHYINLYHSTISKFRLDYIHFTLLFPDSVVVSDFPFTKRKISDDEKEAIYEGLLKSFTDSGQIESLKLLDIEHQTWLWERGAFKYFSWLPKYWWNFGYNKENIFLWSFFFVTLFTMINAFVLEYLNKKVYNVENIPEAIGSLPWRLWYSLVYTSSIFFRLTLKIEKIDFKRVGGTLYLLLIYSLGLVCLAYMANFVIQR